MILIDCDYNGDVFDLDLAFFAHELDGDGTQAWFPAESLGAKVMVVFMDIYGNDAQELTGRNMFVKKRGKNLQNRATKVSGRARSRAAVAQRSK